MSKENEKNPRKSRGIVAGLDIGTTKVAFVIGESTDEGIEILGLGTAPNSGMKQGVVVNIESTSESIKKAKEEAELMSGVEVNSVLLAVGGSHIESFDSSGMVAIRNEEVKQEDVNRVIEAAKAVAIPNDRQVLHVLPKSFQLDGQEGISDPIGMSGVRLESSVHIVTGQTTAIQNALKCTEKAGLSVKNIVLQSLASGMAILSDDEMNLGISMVDIGGGTCDIATFSQGSVIHTGMVPVGGNNFSHDVAMGLRTTQTYAEDLKKQYGTCLADVVGEDDTVEVGSVGGRPERTILRKDLCHILEARTEETLELLQSELKKQDLLPLLGSGVVLTGGGSQLNGMVELGDFIFDVPVRQGIPQKIGGLTDVVRGSEFSTVVGLLIYADKYGTVEKTKKNEETFNFNMDNWARRIKNFLGLSV